MALDFSKLGTGQTVDTVLKPREIFNALPNKKSNKFHYPRDVQSQVWSKWFDRKEERNLVIKMNTGGGKTVVGLLILKSCLNEKNWPVVYIVPDNFLVEQVLSEAKDLGLNAVDNPENESFLKGKAILVTNIYKLINGKSVFGVGDEGIRIPIKTLLIDDAHACVNAVEEQFTLNVSSSNPAHEKIFSIFEEAMKSQSEAKYLEIKAGDPFAYILIPYWHWQENLSNVMQVLIENKNNEEIKFKWALIKENLERCSCVISKHHIEITSNCIPIDVIPSLSNASRKIFMTATLSDDSVLATHFGVSSQYLNTPITPDSAGDVGDRLILLPQALNTNMFDSDVKELCVELSKEYNVVVIVPSNKRVEFWEDAADLILNKDSILQGIEQLKTTHIGLTILVNKYDGIDLPENACRLLVIDGLPTARNSIDKIRQSELSGSSNRVNQIVHKVEQGMGRGIRSNDDYCVIFLMGKDLTSQLYMGETLKLFSPATKAQLELSEQIADQIKDKGANEVKTVINYCLKRDPQWVKLSRGIMADLNYSNQNESDSIKIALREAYDLDRSGKPQEAARRILNEINRSNEDLLLRGVLKQYMAEYINKYDKVESQKTQLSAISDNLRVLKPIEGICYRPLQNHIGSQAIKCSTYLKEKFKDGNKLIIYAEGVFSKLIFSEGTANVFEDAIKELAYLLGFIGQRPENDYGKGPDNLWLLDDLKFLVIECKNGATTDLICKHDCNQLNGSEVWFNNNYGNGAKCVPIMIHLSACFEYACSPSVNIKIMNKGLLEKLVNNTRQFIKSIATDNKFEDSQTVKQHLAQYKLEANDISANYTTPFRTKKT
ncbi:TPA: DEAD/DEAH box helicase family protein [Legionella pneumophila]|uniref:helicase C-terminal domain-containing protein n=1 Tax=Legionella pneumophila TaxID=446 RepID=UPI0010111C84|nr:helicase C-terminal domain-containing protein [Legionella pneumophila]MCW8407212.1 DEAD/DEAH box helicase family protein [Legionella pneumophila]MCZ4684958.1 DEAD/DEAH box helicase family protein [Legionella pneumophila]MDW9045336.1 helicase C-terminal domain-containing protein [Legionella pneumophila]MDW9054598.1 helicase C-terminal domain-containing protein [Legionella pneumophila]MDW9057774.1 helicase C-terminal domain-containing protein [Legionella pneumophila]